MRRLTVLCLAAGSLAPPPVVAMDLPRPYQPSDFNVRVQPQPVNQTTRRNSEEAVRKRDLLRTVRLIVLGGIACAGLIVLLRARSRLADPATETPLRNRVSRILPRRRTGRVLQLDPPDRHAPETRR